MVELWTLRKITGFWIGILIAIIPCPVPLLKFVESKDWRYDACKPANCGTGPDISYPFYILDESSSNGTICGSPGFEVSCKDNQPVFLGSNSSSGPGYIITSITYQNQTVRLVDDGVYTYPSCIRPSSFTYDRTSLHFGPSVVDICALYNCTDAFPAKYMENPMICASGDSSNSYVVIDNNEINCSAMPCQSYVSAPVDLDGGRHMSARTKINYIDLLEKGFTLTWAGISCTECEKTGGHCGSDANGTTICYCPDQPHGSYCKQGKSKLGVILGTAGGALLVLLVIVIIVFIVWYRKQGIYGFSDFISISTSRISSKLEDLELGSIFFGVPVFSYYELRRVTKNFDRSNQLGAGGFGTVYYGRLRDGREVAVKCLYENTYKRIEQFKNEVEILTRLRHRNLVSLYGCTSRRSRELLLVYEYVANGTVADHLHGDRAMNNVLTWPIRMNIAIETAAALAYLHASDTIHRDVKTSNILLDHNCSVKVADFGLSRLFPSGVSHISTAPQGTPGYVDPEYHQCYQLTDKSDVYSFGVVLIELISSMPAVDITRHRNEINLATFAVSRIQKSELDQLIDPSLQPENDAEVKRMTASVAGLAFRCLQLQKDMRPTMDEVVKILKTIQSGKENFGDTTEETSEINSETVLNTSNALLSPEYENVLLIKKDINMNKKSTLSSNPTTEGLSSSPTTVFCTATSGSTTASISG